MLLIGDIMMTRLIMFSAMAALLSSTPTLAPVSDAAASMPVPKIMIGCVVNGVFVSRDGYSISVARSIGKPVDLGSHEGRRLRIRGFLLSSDNFILKGRPKDLGRCPAPRPSAR